MPYLQHYFIVSNTAWIHIPSQYIYLGAGKQPHRPWANGLTVVNRADTSGTFIMVQPFFISKFGLEFNLSYQSDNDHQAKISTVQEVGETGRKDGEALFSTFPLILFQLHPSVSYKIYRSFYSYCHFPLFDRIHIQLSTSNKKIMEPFCLFVCLCVVCVCVCVCFCVCMFVLCVCFHRYVCTKTSLSF